MATTAATINTLNALNALLRPLRKSALDHLWLGETEGAEFWLSCPPPVKSRGAKGLLIACVDGLAGLPEAIRVADPQAKVQLCLVHLVRAALKYVTNADSRKAAADLKAICAAAVVEAEQALEKFAEVGGEVPDDCAAVAAEVARPDGEGRVPGPVHQAVDTTNVIASASRAIRKFTRNRKPYPRSGTALELVCLAIHEASKKWARPIMGWEAVLNHFTIAFEGRIPANRPMRGTDSNDHAQHP